MKHFFEEKQINIYDEQELQTSVDLAEHDDAVDVSLPDHSPEVVTRDLHGSLCYDVLLACSLK